MPVGADEETRRSSVEFALANNVKKAALWFKVSGETIRRWMKERGYYVGVRKRRDPLAGFED